MAYSNPERSTQPDPNGAIDKYAVFIMSYATIQ